MCAEKLEILIIAIDKASAPLKNIEKGLRDTGSPSVQNNLAGNRLNGGIYRYYRLRYSQRRCSNCYGCTVERHL